MQHKIPSTAMLVSFESVTRHEGFARTTEELSPTRSTICRQIATLEELFSVKLFRRSWHGVKLIEARSSYSWRMAVRPDAVERDALAVMGRQGGGVIELAVVPTLGTQWLLPQFKRSQQLHPKVTTNLTNRTRLFLFVDTEFDAAPYFGDANRSGTVSHFLMCENPVPVCNPELLGGCRTLNAERVAGLPLMQRSTQPYAWRQWFHSQGLDIAHDMSGPRYGLFSVLVQAAVHGMGIALILSFLIRDGLVDGKPIVPM